MTEFDPGEKSAEEVFPGVWQTEDGDQMIHDPLMGETLVIDDNGEVEETISDS